MLRNVHWFSCQIHHDLSVAILWRQSINLLPSIKQYFVTFFSLSNFPSFLYVRIIFKHSYFQAGIYRVSNDNDYSWFLVQRFLVCKFKTWILNWTDSSFTNCLLCKFCVVGSFEIVGISVEINAVNIFIYSVIFHFKNIIYIY